MKFYINLKAQGYKMIYIVSIFFKFSMIFFNETLIFLDLNNFQEQKINENMNTLLNSLEKCD